VLSSTSPILTTNLRTDLTHRPPPTSSKTLFDAKAAKSLSFKLIPSELRRSEVAVAEPFYGQAQASSEDVKKLSCILDVPESKLAEQLYGIPRSRTRGAPCPPVEPLIYR
jgi:cyanate lyase